MNLDEIKARAEAATPTSETLVAHTLAKTMRFMREDVPALIAEVEKWKQVAQEQEAIKRRYAVARGKLQAEVAQLRKLFDENNTQRQELLREVYKLRAVAEAAKEYLHHGDFVRAEKLDNAFAALEEE